MRPSGRRMPNRGEGALMKHLPLAPTLFLAFALTSATARAQAPLPGQNPPSFSPADLDRIVSPIALYPDPLLAQVFAAATYPDDIQEAASWADGHSYLTGDSLSAAIVDDQLPWDPSVQALFPFPSVLDMMARDMARGRSSSATPCSPIAAQ